MHKRILFVLIYTAFVAFAVSCSSGSSNTHNHSEKQNVNTEVYYTCTMHPEVHSDKPGKCPKCGMELVKKEAAVSDSTQTYNHTDSMQNQ